MTDCSMIYLRKKDDPANAVIGGALTGYLLAFRGGQKVALKNAAIGGFILLAIEGFGIWTNLKAAKRANSAQLQLQEGTEKNSTVKRAMQTGKVNNVRLPYVNIDSQNVDFISNQAYRRHIIDSEKKGMMQGSEEL
jgi:Tim17/Tim22/Tim23/Pmp24 family